MSCKSCHTCHKGILFLLYEQSLYDSFGLLFLLLLCTVFTISSFFFITLSMDAFHVEFVVFQDSTALTAFFAVSRERYVMVQCVVNRPFINVNTLPHSSQCTMPSCTPYSLSSLSPLNYSFGLAVLL